LEAFYVTAPLKNEMTEIRPGPKILNPYLVRLGIVLLELAEQKSFEHWISEYQTVSPGTEIPRTVEEEAGLAWTWLKQSGTSFGGQGYADVIEKCLKSTCTFGQSGLELMSSVETRISIYRDVVEQLEIIYEMFTNEL
jgi:hypothetical protein